MTEVEVLQAQVELLSAHVENLMERVLVLEEGVDWQYMVRCHDCTLTGTFSEQDLANKWCDEHATQRTPGGSRLYHMPYVSPVVKR